MKLRQHAIAAFVVLGVGLSAAPTAALAAYVVTPFDVPGSSSTDIWDINDAGQFVGTAVTDRQFGYLYTQGSLLRLDGPAGAEYISALGISESAAVVGVFGDSTRPRQVVNYVWDPVTQTQVPQLVTESTQRGFIWEGGAYTAVDVPFAGATGTSLRAISPDGRYVSGTYADDPSGFGINGFVLDRSTGTFTALTWGAGFGIAQGINGAGQMVGDMSVRSQGYLRNLDTGTYSTFSFADVARLAPRAINDVGQIAGWLRGAGAGSPTLAWVGTAAGYQTIAVPGATLTIGEGNNNLGQVVGLWNDATDSSHGFIATPAIDPVDQSVAGVYTFSTAVVADIPIFIDPLVAVGYDYKIGSGNPLFKSVSLPVGIGDNRYLITVGDQSFEVGGNEIFDFTTHGFAAGVAAFTVTGIEAAALLDPADATAFVTRLTFVGSGNFTGSQTALTFDYVPGIPEPGAALLMLAGLAGLAWFVRRRKSPPGRPKGEYRSAPHEGTSVSADALTRRGTS